MYQCVFTNYVSDHRVDVISVNGDTNNLRGPIYGTSDIVCPVPNGFSPFTVSGLYYHHLIVEIQCSILEIGNSEVSPKGCLYANRHLQTIEYF